MPTITGHCFRKTARVATLILGAAVSSPAACIPKNLATPAPKDAVAIVLAQQSTCPVTAMAFGEALKRAGVRLEPTMVNFVGFHRPAPGAFFLFEIASTPSDAAPSAMKVERGDLVFGHFTAATNDGRLVSNTEDLTIELIAWDPDKQFYNFYELVSRTWFYRGDSKDILDDIELLHRQRAASAKPFGKRLRCSGCHVSGGLVQKELAVPHNDWFTQARKLSVGSLKPDAFVKSKLADLADADELSKVVAASYQRLATSPGYQKVLAARSMQERLRPLFCAVEVNIESDPEPFDDHKPALRVPSAFLVDPRLAAAELSVSRQHYDAALQTLRSRLPDTPGRTDADHGWLAPVKAQSDIAALEALIQQGVVDEEFRADVLAIDFTNPVFSATRCGLLKLVPPSGGAGFVTNFQGALRGASQPGAVELLNNLMDASRNAAFHQKQATAFLDNCKKRARDSAAVLEWTRLLAQRRSEVTASEISMNPQGHILEDPGRVVFPAVQPPAAPGRLTLNQACQVQ